MGIVTNIKKMEKSNRKKPADPSQLAAQSGISRHITILGLFASMIILAYLFTKNSLLIYSIMLIAPLPALFYGYLGVRYFGLESYQGKSLLFIMISIFFAGIGKIIGSLNNESILSLAHVFYFAVRPAFTLAIYYNLKVIDPFFFAKQQKLLKLISALAVILAGYHLIFHLAWDYSLSSLENLILLGYYLADSFLLAFVFFAAYIVYLFFQGRYKYYWLALTAGALSFSISQIAYLRNFNTYHLGHIIDLGWYLGYLFFALSFILVKNEAEKSMTELKDALQKKRYRKI